MSKKLLLNNYSENGLMPVMDGLVCWLDGRDGSGTDTIWRDRSGNNNHGILNGDMNTVTDKWEDGFLQLKNSTCLIPTLLFNSVKSICLYSDFKYVAVSGWQRFISESNGDNTICFWDNNMLSLNGLRTGVPDKSGTQCLYLEISDDKKSLICKKIDNIDINFDAKNRNITANSVIQINGKGNVDKSNQLVSSILVYNRALTEEEIQQNYLYEQSIERGE